MLLYIAYLPFMFFSLKNVSITSQALKKAITLQPSNHKLWNSLGVVTASKGNVASIMVHYT